MLKCWRVLLEKLISTWYMSQHLYIYICIYMGSWENKNRLINCVIDKLIILVKQCIVFGASDAWDMFLLLIVYTSFCWVKFCTSDRLVYRMRHFIDNGRPLYHVYAWKCGNTWNVHISHIHYRKHMVYLESTLKNSYLTFWFAGNGLAPPTNKYCDFNASLAFSVMDDKCNLQSRKLKIRSRVYTNIYISRVSIIVLWIYKNCVCNQ